MFTSIASWATSGMHCWWTRETSPFINSKVLLWISWPGLPWFYKMEQHHLQTHISLFIHVRQYTTNHNNTFLPLFQCKFPLTKSLISKFPLISKYFPSQVNISYMQHEIGISMNQSDNPQKKVAIGCHVLIGRLAQFV